jgi:hypothetical protein
LNLAAKRDGETIAPEKLPYETSRPPVLGAANLVAAIDGGKSVVAVFTREGDRLTKRGEVSLEGAGRFAKYKLVRDARQKRLGAEIYSAENRLLSAIYLMPDGILEFRPGDAKGVTVNVTPTGAHLKYGIVPSLMGTDLVYSALDPRLSALAPGPSSLTPQPSSLNWHLPSMNLFVGLVEGGDSMMVGVWPHDPGTGRGVVAEGARQVASLRMSGTGGARQIDGFSLQPAQKSFYLTFLAKPGIWHAEPLKPDYLEKDTVIAWKRPFDAKWIGRFFVASEEMNYPYYFRYDRAELWGRTIRGWFYWPVWFEDDETMIHFEKRFPPRGEMLIYYLEKHPDFPARTAILSPVEVMQTALGADEAARLLDFAGIEERTVVAHGLCVCEMTGCLQKYFDLGREVEEQARIARYADDVALFIRNMRQRLSEFRDFATQTKELLKARAAAEPKLADAAGRLLGAIGEFEGAYRANMPTASLDEVWQWTRQFNALAREARQGNNKAFDAVAEKCRGVSGAQDDLARDLNILAIRFMEKAGQEAIASPEHAKLAADVIALTRQVLRHPSVWEPRRYHRLQIDPGEPDLDPAVPD